MDRKSSNKVVILGLVLCVLVFVVALILQPKFFRQIPTLTTSDPAHEPLVVAFELCMTLDHEIRRANCLNDVARAGLQAGAGELLEQVLLRFSLVNRKVDRLIELGALYDKKNRAEDAKRIFKHARTTAQAMERGVFSSLVSIAKHHADAGRLDQVKMVLSEAENAKKNGVNANYRIADAVGLYVMIGDTEKASEQIKQMEPGAAKSYAISAGLRNCTNVTCAQQMLALARESDEFNSDLLVEAAHLHIRAGEVQEARRLVGQAFALEAAFDETDETYDRNFGPADHFGSIVCAWLRLGDVPAATESLQKSQAPDSWVELAIQSLGKKCVNGDTSQAHSTISALNDVFHLNEMMGLVNKGEDEEEEPSQFIKDFRSGFQDTGRVIYMFHLANAYYVLGQRDESEQWFGRATDLLKRLKSPREQIERTTRAACDLVEIGNNADASRLLSSYSLAEIKGNTRKLEALTALAEVYQKLDERNAATELLEHVLERIVDEYEETEDPLDAVYGLTDLARSSIRCKMEWSKQSVDLLRSIRP